MFGVTISGSVLYYFIPVIIRLRAELLDRCHVSLSLKTLFLAMLELNSGFYVGQLVYSIFEFL